MLIARFILSCAAILVLSAVFAVAQPSAELREALASFRTEGPKGWAFTQTSRSTEFSRVETFDPLRAAHLQWDLVLENDAPPSDSKVETYRQQQTRRTGGRPAPNVKEQLDYTTARLEREEDGREYWHFNLKPGGSDDRSAEHMAARITFHKASDTIEEIELTNFEPFSPVFGVQVETARTHMRYSLPDDALPSLLQEITVTIRGRAFYFKSLDSDMKVVYSDYRYCGKGHP
jgi:hypothetical protein